MKKIIDEVVKAYRGYKGLDEIKRGIRLAMAMSGEKWTDYEYSRILDCVLYELSEN